MTSERVALRMYGGPDDGRTIFTQVDWPPPKALQVSGTSEGFDHVYVREGMSILPAGLPGVLRGATYQWVHAYEWKRRMLIAEANGHEHVLENDGFSVVCRVPDPLLGGQAACLYTELAPDPDPTTYAMHAFAISDVGTHCIVCGREEDGYDARHYAAIEPWERPSKVDPVTESEGRLLDGNR